MPTPLKDHTVRARANKSSTRAVLQEQYEGEIDPPVLPARYVQRKIKDKRGCIERVEQVETTWQPLTLAMWDDIWASPMAREWLDSDVYGLYAMAILFDEFLLNPCARTHGEYDRARKSYGLTPIDRRRLEWKVEMSSSAQAEGNKRRAAEVVAAEAARQAPATPTEANDPRLHVC